MPVDVESSKGAPTCKTYKKVFARNTKIGFQKQPGHPLTLEAYLHGERPHPKCLAQKERGNPSGNPNVFQKVSVRNFEVSHQ